MSQSVSSRLNFLSVVICTAERLPELERCLKAFERQPKSRFELILVDNRTDDQLKKIVQKYSALYRLHHIKIKKRNLPFARNTGILKAKSDFIVCMDDDAYPFSGWVDQTLSVFKKHKQAVIIGGSFISISKKYLSYFSQLYYTWNDLQISIETNKVIGTHFLINLKNRRRLKGARRIVFNPDFSTAADDSEACFYVRKYGGLIVFDPNLQLFHSFRVGWKNFVLRQIQYAFGDFQLWLLYPKEEISPYMLLLSHPLSLVNVCIREIIQKTQNMGLYWFPAVIVRELSYIFGLLQAKIFFDEKK